MTLQAKTARFLKAALVALFGVAAFSFAPAAHADYYATTTLSAASSTFTVPTGVSSITVEITAGGGGGGGGADTFGGGGGGAGASFSTTTTVTAGQVISYTIGQGGQGGLTGSTYVPAGNGFDGSDSIFGNIIAAAGKGGAGAVYDNVMGGQGGLAGGIGGQAGDNGQDFIGQRTYGGNGGSTIVGTGGTGGSGNKDTYTLPTVGTNGSGGGAGSGWAYYADPANKDNGAAGGNGSIVLTYLVETPVLANIFINPIDPTILVGATTTFTASTTDQFGDPFATSTTWFSSNAAVGTIDSSTGLFTAISAGTTTIFAVASNGFLASTTVTVSNQPPVLTGISISPIDPTVATGSTVSFTASTTDQFGDPFATSTVWTSSDTAIGTIDQNTGLFTAISAGTTTVTATAGMLSTSTLVTVTASSSAPINTVSIANSTIDGTYYVLYATTSGAIMSLTGTTTVTDSTTTLSSMNNSTVSTSTLSGTTADNVNIADSTSTNSTLTNSTITDCTILNSSVKNYHATGCYVAFSVLDPSSGQNIDWYSTTTNSQVFNSDLSYSQIINNSYVATSTISSSTISQSIVLDSTVSTSSVTNAVIDGQSVIDSSTVANSTSTGSTIASSTVSGNSVIASSTLTNVTATGSSITNTTLADATATDAVIDNNIAATGTIEIGGQTFVISTSTPLATLTDYPPVAAFVATSTGLTVAITDETTDLNAGTTFPDSWTYDWHFGDGATSTVSASSTGQNIMHTYASAGTYTITLDVTDAYGASSTASSSITVSASGGSGTTTPVAGVTLAPATLILTVGSSTGTLTATVSPADATNQAVTWASDDPSVATVANGVVTPVATGTADIIVTTVDGGFVATSTVFVAPMIDTVPPTITILGNNPLAVLATSTGAYADPGATAVDNVDGDITSRIVASSTVDIAVPGTYTVTYTVSDNAGNAATSTRIVHVLAVPDTTAPVITVLGSNPATVLLGATYVDAGATATDNVDGDLTANIVTTSTVDTNATGTYAVDYSVTDSSGNTATSSRTVDVIASIGDTVPPVITILGANPASVTVGSTYVDAGATALDNIDGDVTSRITSSSTVNTSVAGTYEVVYTVSDNAGNTASTTRIVDVVAASADTIPPVITITGGTPTTVIATSSPYIDAGATATDNVDGTVPVSTIFNNVIASTTGTYSVVYEATDTAGNMAEATRTVDVINASTTADVIPPAITITGGTPITVFVGSTYTDEGATAVDDVDGPVAATTTFDNVDTSVAGTYEVIYSATDAAGNVATATRQVIVVPAPIDTVPPVITLVGGSPITVTLGSAFADPGATAYDAYDATATAVTATGTVDTNATGTYTITYTSEDAAGNIASTTRQVIVIAADTMAPIITLNSPNPMDVVKGTTFTDPGATALDNVDGDLTSKIVVSGSVDTSTLGTYILTYTVSDNAGNTASTTRIVNVIKDNVPPVITVLGNNPAEVTVGSTYVDAGATSTDNIDGDLTSKIIVNDPVSTSSPVGVYFVIYTVTDSSGNTASAVRVVNVHAPDTVPPVITILGQNPVSILAGSTYVDAGATAQDNIDGDITSRISSSSDVNTAVPGIYHVIYTVSDAAGNVASSTRTVNVLLNDTVPPVITILGANPASVTVGSTYVDAGATALDNIDGDVTSRITSSSTVNTSVAGTYEVVYTVSDNAGNVASSTRTVDVTAAPAPAPVFSTGGGNPIVPITRTAPTITVLGQNPATITVGSTYADAGATAQDTIDGNITSRIVTTGLPIDTSTPGAHTITYAVTDNGNLTSTAMRQVNVVASTEPSTPTSTEVAVATSTPIAPANQPSESSNTGTAVGSVAGTAAAAAGSIAGSLPTVSLVATSTVATSSAASSSSATSTKNASLVATVEAAVGNIPQEALIFIGAIILILALGFLLSRRDMKPPFAGKRK